MNEKDYRSLIKQVEALAQDCGEWLPLLANVSALIFSELSDINWAGFYIVKGHELILGPFQGKVACTRIAKGRGVCGTAWEKDEIQLVPDVHEFLGHIACDADSRSELVVPIHNDGVVIAVMDIDSPLKDRFDETDKKGFADIVSVIEEKIVW